MKRLIYENVLFSLDKKHPNFNIVYILYWHNMFNYNIINDNINVNTACHLHHILNMWCKLSALSSDGFVCVCLISFKRNFVNTIIIKSSLESFFHWKLLEYYLHYFIFNIIWILHFCNAKLLFHKIIKQL